jgi:hypothetical protein
VLAKDFVSLVGVRSLHLLQFLSPGCSKASPETLPNYRKMGMIPASLDGRHFYVVPNGHGMNLFAVIE